MHPRVALHLVLPWVPVAARLLSRRDAVVAAAVQRFRVELLMRGAGLECVGGGEMAAFRFQVGTCLNIGTQLVSEVCKLSWPLSNWLTDSLRMLWDRCHRVVADCPVWASGASPCPHDHFHSNNLLRTNRLCHVFFLSQSLKNKPSNQRNRSQKKIFFCKLVMNFFLPNYTASLHRRQLLWWGRSWGWDVKT